MISHKKTIAHSFKKYKRRYYVPISSVPNPPLNDIELPIRKYRQIILKRWNYPEYMFNAAPGGHLSALRMHDSHKYFAIIDLKSFFESITDTKVYRSLRSIGLLHSEAFELTGESTVRDGKRMHLPRGFHQSSILASLVFDRSLIGSLIRSKKLSSHVTVYNDDIILSSSHLSNLTKDYVLLVDAAVRCNFQINTSKTQGPREVVKVFNLLLSCEELSFAEHRIEEFVADMLTMKEFCEDNDQDYFLSLLALHGDYIFGVNRRQFYRVIGRVTDNRLSEITNAVPPLKKRATTFRRDAGGGLIWNAAAFETHKVSITKKKMIAMAIAMNAPSRTVKKAISIGLQALEAPDTRAISRMRLFQKNREEVFDSIMSQVKDANQKILVRTALYPLVEEWMSGKEKRNRNTDE